MLYLLVFIISLFIVTNKPSRRHLFFCLLAFYLIVSPKIAVPFAAHSNLRLMLFIAIFLQNKYSIITFLANASANYSFRFTVLWIFYILFSTIFVAQNYIFSSIYEPIGTIIFYILFAYYVNKYSMIEIRHLMYFILFAYFLNIYGRLPFIFEIDSMPLVIDVTRHQTAGASGMYSLPILFLLSSRTRRFSVRLLLWIYVFASGIVVYLASARAPTFGYVVVFLIYQRSLRRYILFTILVATILIFVIGTKYAEFADERATTLLSSEPRAGDPDEVEFRKRNVQYGIESFMENPFFGVGYTNWQSVYETRSTVLGYSLSAHNGYIKILSETGLVGAILLLMMVVTNLWGTPFKLSKNFNENLLYTATILTISVFIYSIGGDELYGRSLYIFLAIALGAKLKIQRESLERELLQATSDPQPSSDSHPSVPDSYERPGSGNRS